jgi:hypothetical protein
LAGADRARKLRKLRGRRQKIYSRDIERRRSQGDKVLPWSPASLLK